MAAGASVIQHKTQRPFISRSRHQTTSSTKQPKGELAKKVSGKDEVKVTKSRISFTRFEVLENKAATKADEELGI